MRKEKILQFVKIMRARSAAPQLGVVLSSFAKDILFEIQKKYPGVFGSFGMTIPRAESFIEEVRARFAAGYSRELSQAKALRDQIAQKMKMSESEKLGSLRLMVFLADFTPEKYPVLGSWLSGKGALQALAPSNVAAAASQAVKTGAAAAGEHLKTVAIETIKDAGGLVSSAYTAANEAAPWYLKPRNLIIAGAAGLFLFYGLPLLRAIPRPKYRQNPVSKRAAAAALYEDFHAKEPRRRFSVPQIDTDELTFLGDALEIGYRSAKWTNGAKNNYLHQFGPGVKVCATSDGKALVIFGGKMHIEPRGIVN